MHNPIRKRLSILVAAALAVPFALVAFSQPASAAVVGQMNLVPTSGNQSTVLDANTLVKCPSTSKFIRVAVEGPGIAAGSFENNLLGATEINSSLTPDNGMGGYHLFMTLTFFDVFQNTGVLHPGGTYNLRAICLADDAFTEQGDIAAQVKFTASAANFSGTWSQIADVPGDPTTTVLTTNPPDPIMAGAQTTLTATVTPSSAPGTVQFKRNGANIGTPVAVVAGVATTPATTLAAGSASLTAVFTPTVVNPVVWSPSTSAAVNYVVLGTPAITGIVRVGSTVTCAITVGGTQTFAWLKNGVAQAGYTKSTAKVPAPWLNGSLACRATVAKGVTSIQQTSPAKKVALGAKLAATKKPTLKGKATVGKTLTCSAGKWSPKATSYKYSWLRNGKAIKHQTKAKHKLVKADKNKSVGCMVVAKSKGYADGKAKSKTVKVKAS